MATVTIEQTNNDLDIQPQTVLTFSTLSEALDFLLSKESGGSAADWVVSRESAAMVTMTKVYAAVPDPAQLITKKFRRFTAA